LTSLTAIAAVPDFAALLQRQRTFFASGATLPLEFRRAVLQSLRKSLVNSEKPLLAALYADLRKPPQEAYAAEIGMVLSEIDYALKHLKAWMKPRRASVPWMVWPGRARIAPRPLGVSLIIGPWNYPVQLLLLPLIGAIAAGNCAVVKPSELAPATSDAVAALLGDAFSAEHVACIQGGRVSSEALLSERFDKIFFTGSSVVGKAVACAAAKNLTPVTLELGGKCPVIVAPDANIPVAARRIIWAKAINAGQSCVAPDYVLAHESIRSQLIEQMIAAVRAMFGENVQKSADYGRIVNPRHFDRLLNYLKEGAIIAGGQNDPSDLFLAPTLLENISPGARILDEEIFGPILPVLPYNDLSEAVQFIAARPSPLAVYLFTAEPAARRQVEQIRCGAICVNDLMVHLFAKKLPFGGIGDSGMGSYHGKFSFDGFTHYQTNLQCSAAIDPSFRYVPPKLSLQRYKQLLSRLLRW